MTLFMKMLHRMNDHVLWSCDIIISSTEPSWTPRGCPWKKKALTFSASKVLRAANEILRLSSERLKKEAYSWGLAGSDRKPGPIFSRQFRDKVHAARHQLLHIHNAHVAGDSHRCLNPSPGMHLGFDPF